MARDSIGTAHARAGLDYLDKAKESEERGDLERASARAAIAAAEFAAARMVLQFIATPMACLNHRQLSQWQEITGVNG